MIARRLVGSTDVLLSRALGDAPSRTDPLNSRSLRTHEVRLAHSRAARRGAFRPTACAPTKAPASALKMGETPSGGDLGARAGNGGDQAASRNSAGVRNPSAVCGARGGTRA